MDKVPYMQRGGAWDNSDLVTKRGKESMLAKKKKEKVVFNNKVSKNVEKKAWSKTDKEYAAVSFARGSLCCPIPVCGSRKRRAVNAVVCTPTCSTANCFIARDLLGSGGSACLLGGHM